MSSNKTKIRVLRDVRRLITSNREEFVCCAITTCNVWQKSNDYRMACNDLHREINDNMARDGCGGYGVDSWLTRVVPGLTFKDLSPEILREYRLAWLDNWIRELKAADRKST